MVVLATLEAALRICVGCIIYNALARRGVVRAPECVDCNDIALRRRSADAVGTR